ncbi:hypothetical protein ACWDFL_19850 [Streptomyces bungoensis]
MGVFARLLGRSKTAQDAAAAEVPPAGTGPDEAEVAAAVAETARTAEAEGTAEDGQEAAAAEADAAGAAAAENAEIPQQQSAAGVADREAGEGART